MTHRFLLIDFLRNLIHPLKSPFLQIFDPLLRRLVSQQRIKNLQKSSIFSGKAGFARSLICSILISVHMHGGEVEALKSAREQNRPIVAVFLGDGKCMWSQTLKREVLQVPDFYERVGKEAVLWEVSLGQESADRLKYSVSESPLILLLDPAGKEFARLRYMPVGASAYADEIDRLIAGFEAVCNALRAPHAPFDEEAWKGLYMTAKAFSVPYFKQVILERGVKEEKGTFFHLEKYAALLEKYKLKNPLVLKFKEQLLNRDPHNAAGSYFKVAVLEFQKMASSLKPKDRIEKAIKPLLRYIDQFKEKDEENCWRAQLLLAEYLFMKNAIEPAIQYAHSAYQSAPEEDKPKISETIALMERKLSLEPFSEFD